MQNAKHQVKYFSRRKKSSSDTTQKTFNNNNNTTNQYSIEYLKDEFKRIEQHFNEDDRECLTLIGRINFLIRKLPTELMNIFWYYGKCFERMGQYEQAFRCFVLNSHLYPTNLDNIQSLQNCIIEGSQVRDFENTSRQSSATSNSRKNIEENRALKELQLRQLMVNPSDFELRVFFLRKLIDKYLGTTKRDEKKELELQIYRFALDYFHRKYISKIVNIQANYSMLNMEQIQEFKVIIELLQQNKLERYALELNRLVIKLAPTLDPQLFLSQYDLYLKFDDFLNAFKSYSHFMYLTGNNSIESYAICGECLERAGYYHKAIIAFWQCHLLQQQELMTYRQQEPVKDFDSDIDEISTTPQQNVTHPEEKIAQYDKKSLKYLFHIKRNIVPKLKSFEIPLTTEQQEMVERIVQITELENDYSINN